jgi:signal transduction histidine kinase
MKKTYDITELNHVLETQIIDTGVGIAADRQEILFVPFKELKDRIGVSKSQNDNIGIGLSCSKEICLKMGGDIKLKKSQKGLTVMAFKLPVKISFKADFSQNEFSSGMMGSA